MYRSVRSHVREVRRTFPFDAIIGSFAYPDVVAASHLATDAGCPLIAIVLGSDINELARRTALRGQIREALLQASSVIAVSRELRDRVVGLGIPVDRIVVQRNGVDGERFVVRDRQEARRHLGVPEISLFLFCRKSGARKGTRFLIEALPAPRA